MLNVDAVLSVDGLELQSTFGRPRFRHGRLFSSMVLLLFRWSTGAGGMHRECVGQILLGITNARLEPWSGKLGGAAAQLRRGSIG